MCKINIDPLSYECAKPQNLKEELIKVVGLAKAETIIKIILHRFKDIQPLQFESLKVAGLGRFTETGNFVEYFDDAENLYTYLLEFTQIVASKNCIVKNTYTYSFN